MAKAAPILYLKRLTNIRLEICRKDRLNLPQNKRRKRIFLAQGALPFRRKKTHSPKPRKTPKRP
jgi:hypothetical protein